MGNSKQLEISDFAGGDSLAGLGIERPPCGAGIRRDRPLFLSVPVRLRPASVNRRAP